MQTHTIDIPEHLIKKIEEEAEEYKISFDEMIVLLIEEGIDSRRGLRLLLDRALRNDMTSIPVVFDEDERPNRFKK